MKKRSAQPQTEPAEILTEETENLQPSQPQKPPRKPITVKKSSRMAIGLSLVLFFVTFFLQFIWVTVAPPREDEIKDWRFLWGTTQESVDGEMTSYKQATAENPITKDRGKAFARLQHAIPASEEDRRLVICTDYSPIRVVVDGEELLNSGYGTQTLTGSCYHSVLIPAGSEKKLDVFLHAPLAFSVRAYLEPLTASPLDILAHTVGLALSLTILITGLLLAVLTLLLAARSKYVVRLLLLSCTVLTGGFTALIYSFSRTTSLLTSPYWFSVLQLLEFILMILMYITVLSCCSKTLRLATAWIPAAILSLLVVIFPAPWAIRTVAAVFTAAQVFIAVRAVMILARTTAADVPDVGSVKALLIYASLTGIYNTFCLFLGTSFMSGYLFTCSLALFCLVSFIVYCRQIIYLDIKRYERLRQMYTDSEWIEDITGLIATMFLQKTEKGFLTGIAQKLPIIIEKNASIDDESIQVHACAGVFEGHAFTEIYNDGYISDCDYMSLYRHLAGQSQKLIVGNTSADMLFQTGVHGAIIHFENIQCGINSSIQNILKTAYLNLFSAYQNLNLKNDVSNIQEELFINLASIVELKCEATKSHLIIVSALCYELAIQLGMSDEKARLLSMSAMTHDIGKIAIPEAIYKKPGKLTDAEFEVMKQHTQIGFNILSLQSGAFFEMAAVIAQQHHENFDGTGYMGLKGRDIAPAARLVRVVDVVDALLSKRTYKEAWSADRVKQYIQDGRGTLFDPAVADAFLSCADELIALRTHIIRNELS